MVQKIKRQIIGCLAHSEFQKAHYPLQLCIAFLMLDRILRFFSMTCNRFTKTPFENKRVPFLFSRYKKLHAYS